MTIEKTIAAVRPVRRFAGVGIISRCLLPLTIAASVMLTSPATARGPEAIADLTNEVIEAVVNISASESKAASARRDVPPPIPGAPFGDLFDEFRKRRDEEPQRGPRQSESAGSGFVIDPSGIIVTNNHVIGDSNDITVSFTDGSKRKAELVGRDDKLDLAVLKVNADKPLKAVKFGPSENLRIGDWVVAIGNPFGLGGSVTAGIISAHSRDIEQGPYDDYIQTDAAINRGNSGGPLFNLAGEVVGINTAILSPTGGSVGIGFAVPAELAGPTIAQLREFGETRRGWLGVRIQAVDEDAADALGLARAEGALVASIDKEGPAANADIKTGDVIIRYNGKPVKESRDLSRSVAATEVGAKVRVTLLREGKQRQATVTLGRLEDSEKSAAATASEEPGKTTGTRALGLELSEIDDELRQQYEIAKSVSGVVVVGVESASAASDKDIGAGDVIVEVAQVAVATPADVERRVEALRKEGRRSALFLITGRDGETRFVAIRLSGD
ncbi:Do family serine endopeptidase [Pseudochelatococcus contaminans]|uniref:Probable periplasmic serine endoprotease DegP-like n=1 Tax=Pseudochelatococcus contaminans TaxID=1538103 RepID=A0A7W5Z2A0_9HYPH|nr:Do family serine endopeptidase [Pseudochelatococcus contaminans]MBB3808530.1 serine protease Do [Pseudochelatococcus contaminans]